MSIDRSLTFYGGASRYETIYPMFTTIRSEIRVRLNVTLIPLQITIMAMMHAMSTVDETKTVSYDILI